MAKWTPAKADTLEALAREILHNYSRGRALVAVDGEGNGPAQFADDLAAAFGALGNHAVRASMDDFLRPGLERSLGGDDSAASFYREAFDYAAFRRTVAHPFRSGESEGKEHAVPADAILLVDGAFLNRPELAGLWNYSIWLDSIARPGHADAADALYDAEAHPRSAAVAIIDNSDVEHPRRVFADAC